MKKVAVIAGLCCLLALCFGARAEETTVSVHVSPVEAPRVAVDSLDGRAVIGHRLEKDSRYSLWAFCGDDLVGAPPWRVATPEWDRGLVLWNPDTRLRREFRLGRDDLHIVSCSQEREFILLANKIPGSSGEHFHIHKEQTLHRIGEKPYGELIWTPSPVAALAWTHWPGKVSVADPPLDTELHDGTRIHDMDDLPWRMLDWNPVTRQALMATGRVDGTNVVHESYSFVTLGADAFTVIRSGGLRLRSGGALQLSTKDTQVRSTHDRAYIISVPRAEKGSAGRDEYRCLPSAAPGVLLDCDRSAVLPKGYRFESLGETRVGGHNSERYAILYFSPPDESEVLLRLFDRKTERVSKVGFRAPGGLVYGPTGALVSGSRLLVTLEADAQTVLLNIEDDWFE